MSKADSISWNPHKMLGAPLQTSAILIKEQVNSKKEVITMSILKECNSASASYLFQEDKHYDASLDTGDSSIQCGRRPDAFNLWLMLKVRGQKYFANLIENALEVLEFFHASLKKEDHAQGKGQFGIVIPEFDPKKNLNVCFFIYPVGCE